MSNHHQIFGDVSTEVRFHQHHMPLPRQFTTNSKSAQSAAACVQRACMFPEKGKISCVLLSCRQIVRAAQCASCASRAVARRKRLVRAVLWVGPPRFPLAASPSGHKMPPAAAPATAGSAATAANTGVTVPAAAVVAGLVPSDTDVYEAPRDSLAHSEGLRLHARESPSGTCAVRNAAL